MLVPQEGTYSNIQTYYDSIKHLRWSVKKLPA